MIKQKALQQLQHINALNTKKVGVEGQKRPHATNNNYQDHIYYSTINHI